MKNGIKLTLCALAICAIVFACSKEDDEKKDENTATTGCVSGASFCMTYDGTVKSGTAKLFVANNTRFRIFWENTTANGFEQVEMDIYGNAAGTFTVDTTKLAGTAEFEYFSTNPQALEEGVTGTVNVSSFDPTAGASGTFTLTTANGVKITNGNFINAKP